MHRKGSRSDRIHPENIDADDWERSIREEVRRRAPNAKYYYCVQRIVKRKLLIAKGNQDGIVARAAKAGKERRKNIRHSQ